MSKKKSKKKKAKNLQPPLTFLDKSIYVFCMALSFLSIFVALFFLMQAQESIAASREGTLAYKSGSSTLFAWPALLFFPLSIFIFLLCCMEEKKPIFGNKNIQYGISPYSADCIPLFNRSKYSLYERPSRKRSLKKAVLTWCAVFLATLCLVPFCLFGRTSLFQDHHIEKINTFNQTVETYTPEEFSHLTVNAHRRKSHWRYSITVEMEDGNTFTFSRLDFIADSEDVYLDTMLEIKSFFDTEDITIEDAEDVDRIADYLELDAEQRKKLKKLFSK